MEVIIPVIGFVTGLILTFLFLSLKFKADKSSLTERNKYLESDLIEKEKQLVDEREKVLKLNSDYSALNAEYENVQQKLAEQKNEMEDLQNKFTKEFENLANRIFEEKSNKFTNQNKENIAQILDPLEKKIKEFEKQVEDKHYKDTQAFSDLRRHIEELSKLNQQITKETNDLTKALRGDSKTQGNWGEFILEKILEKSGLSRGREYQVQESINTPDGRQRPDVIIYLPEEKNVVVDSKVSLVDYEHFTSSTDDDERKKYLSEHIRSIRNHIKGLSIKNYQNIEQLKSLDFVLMFIPIEAAFSAAVQNDFTLFDEAFDKNIVIVSPTTLLATLRTIASIWRQEKQNQNALEIAKQGGALYDKFVGFVEDLLTVGKNLDNTKKVYSDAMKKLSEGSGNLVRRTENLKELGAKVTKSLPDKLLDRADEEE
ncbi:MAG: DNA recombination protein RmuC [bacterium]